MVHDANRSMNTDGLVDNTEKTNDSADGDGGSALTSTMTGEEEE